MKETNGVPVRLGHCDCLDTVKGTAVNAQRSHGPCLSARDQLVPLKIDSRTPLLPTKPALLPASQDKSEYTLISSSLLLLRPTGKSNRRR